jgi:hypothetical protein
MTGSWIFVAIMCLAFAGLLKLLDNAFAEENARRRRIRRLEKSQEHAMRSAEDLLVFDQTMTREHLVRVWEEIK